jgi:type IV secretory pathway VirJ component
VLQHRGPACSAHALETALASQPNAHLTWLAPASPADHTLPVEFGALLQWLDPGIEGQGQASASLRGIPLIEMPVANARRAVIFLSGDGGWAALDRGVAAALTADGVAVLGWDCLSYFWQARTPAVLARDLGRVIEEFRARWHLSQVVVAGYSFGASTAPFAISGLPAATRSVIEKVVLLGPTPTTSFEFRLSQWLGSAAHDTAVVAPEVAKLAPLPVWCVHGAKDSEAQCPPLAPPSRVITLPGDHHFNDDYAALARLIAAPALTR